jgi:branched-chain amino acid aminotransferase
VVKGERVTTPPTPADLHDAAVASSVPYPKSAVLPGVTRGVVLELARELGIEAAPGAIDVNRLLDADEVFLTNSVMGVMPVCRIERKAIGNDRPGPVTRRIAEQYAALVGR